MPWLRAARQSSRSIHNDTAVAAMLGMRTHGRRLGAGSSTDEFRSVPRLTPVNK